MVTQATPKMTFALFCATKMDVRNLGLTFEETSNLIGKCKNGQVNEVISYLKNKGGVSKGQVKEQVNWQELYDKAHKAGMEAARKCIPTPMIVEERSNPLNDNSKVKNSYYVPQGPCGFAEVRFKGNTSFGRWAKKNNLCDKSYDGGYYIWIGGQLEEFSCTQSVEIKSSYASAFVKVLTENNVKAYSTSRLD
jgi:hypothetical protein